MPIAIIMETMMKTKTTKIHSINGKELDDILQQSARYGCSTYRNTITPGGDLKVKNINFEDYYKMPFFVRMKIKLMRWWRK